MGNLEQLSLCQHPARAPSWTLDYVKHQISHTDHLATSTALTPHDSQKSLSPWKAIGAESGHAPLPSSKRFGHCTSNSDVPLGLLFPHAQGRQTQNNAKELQCIASTQQADLSIFAQRAPGDPVDPNLYVHYWLTHHLDVGSNSLHHYAQHSQTSGHKRAFSRSQPTQSSAYTPHATRNVIHKPCEARAGTSSCHRRHRSNSYLHSASIANGTHRGTPCSDTKHSISSHRRNKSRGSLQARRSRSFSNVSHSCPRKSPHLRLQSRRVSLLSDRRHESMHRKKLSECLTRVLDLDFDVPGVDAKLMQDILRTLDELDMQRMRSESISQPDAGDQLPDLTQVSNNLPSDDETDETDFSVFQRNGGRLKHPDSVSSTRCILNVPRARFRPLRSEESTDRTTCRPRLSSEIDRCFANTLGSEQHETCAENASSPASLPSPEQSFNSSARITSFSRPFGPSNRPTKPRQQTMSSRDSEAIITPPRPRSSVSSQSFASGNARLPSISSVSSFAIATPSSSFSFHHLDRMDLQQHMLYDIDAEEGEDNDDFDGEVVEVEPMLLRSPSKKAVLRHFKTSRR